MSTEPATPGGWYPDPSDPGAFRWWDGTTWTEHVHAPTVPEAGAAPHGAGAVTAHDHTSALQLARDSSQWTIWPERVDPVVEAPTNASKGNGLGDLFGVGGADRINEQYQRWALERSLDPTGTLGSSGHSNAKSDLVAADIDLLFGPSFPLRLDRAVMARGPLWRQASTASIVQASGKGAGNDVTSYTYLSVDLPRELEACHRGWTLVFGGSSSRSVIRQIVVRRRGWVERSFERDPRLGRFDIQHDPQQDPAMVAEVMDPAFIERLDEASSHVNGTLAGAFIGSGRLMVWGHGALIGATCSCRARVQRGKKPWRPTLQVAESLDGVVTIASVLHRRLIEAWT